MPAHWWVKLFIVPIVGEALSLDVIGGSWVPRKTLGSLFADEWDCVPTLFVVWPGASQPCWVGSDFSKMETSRGTHADK